MVKAPTSEELEQARDTIWRDYRSDVEGVVEDCKRAIKDGEITDSDDLDTWLHETVDGHSRVIYTANAIDCLRASDNDDAYADEMGELPSAKDGGMASVYSQLAYCAFRRDILEELERAGVDPNDPVPEPEDEDDDDDEPEVRVITEAGMGVCPVCEKSGLHYTVEGLDGYIEACPEHVMQVATDALRERG